MRAPVSHVDLLPTVLDTLGYSIPEHVQGRPLRNPANLENRRVFAESFPNLFFGAWRPKLDRTERAVRAGSLKLILSTAGKHEAYDLSQDRAELHNLCALGQAGIQELEEALRGWVRGALAGGSHADAGGKDELRRLKGLGYVQ